MSLKTTKDGEVFTCDRCGLVADPRIGLPDGWVQIAVSGVVRVDDEHKQFCSWTCAHTYDKKVPA